MGANYEVAVIGGGVVGCAVFRAFALHGLRTVLVERGADILSGASKANSAILHTGFDASPGSLELACMRRGYAAYLEIRAALNLPLLETGALVVAWTPDERKRLPEILARGQRNGVPGLRLIEQAELRAREPALSRDALAAVLVPGESVIDPWSAPLAYALQGLANGGAMLRNCEVTAGRYLHGHWTLNTSQGEIDAGIVINCAGLRGDLVEAIARPSPFAIRPRKGQFVVLDKLAARHVKTILLPVPSKKTKGIVVAPTIFGNVLVGPTAEEQDDRDDASTDEATLRRLVAHGRAVVPALAPVEIITGFAGLRPATAASDYQISILPDRRWISIAGIRSTGLTAALGIADHAVDLYRGSFGELRPIMDPICTPVPNLAEHLHRPYENGGEIVCHCERVTRDEIVAALGGALMAGDLGGLRRRTRAMLGRCQGFYCSHRVAALAQSRIGLVLPKADR